MIRDSHCHYTISDTLLKMMIMRRRGGEEERGGGRGRKRKREEEERGGGEWGEKEKDNVHCDDAECDITLILAQENFSLTSASHSLSLKTFREIDALVM